MRFEIEILHAGVQRGGRLRWRTCRRLLPMQATRHPATPGTIPQDLGAMAQVSPCHASCPFQDPTCALQ